MHQRKTCISPSSRQSVGIRRSFPNRHFSFRSYRVRESWASSTYLQGLFRAVDDAAGANTNSTRMQRSVKVASGLVVDQQHIKSAIRIVDKAHLKFRPGLLCHKVEWPKMNRNAFSGEKLHLFIKLFSPTTGKHHQKGIGWLALMILEEKFPK